MGAQHLHSFLTLFRLGKVASTINDCGSFVPICLRQKIRRPLRPNHHLLISSDPFHIGFCSLNRPNDK